MIEWRVEIGVSVHLAFQLSNVWLVFCRKALTARLTLLGSPICVVPLVGAANEASDAPKSWQASAPVGGAEFASPLLFDECPQPRERAVPLLGDAFQIKFNVFERLRSKLEDAFPTSTGAVE